MSLKSLTVRRFLCQDSFTFKHQLFLFFFFFPFLSLQSKNEFLKRSKIFPRHFFSHLPVSHSQTPSFLAIKSNPLSHQKISRKKPLFCRPRDTVSFRHCSLPPGMICEEMLSHNILAKPLIGELNFQKLKRKHTCTAQTQFHPGNS